LVAQFVDPPTFGDRRDPSGYVFPTCKQPFLLLDEVLQRLSSGPIRVAGGIQPLQKRGLAKRGIQS
jgi:hypothetical protein